MVSVKRLFEIKEEIDNGTSKLTEEQWQALCEEQEGVRFCDVCGELMTEGCVWGGGEHTECESCKDKDTTPEDWSDAVEECRAYWTQWEEEMEEDEPTYIDDDKIGCVWKGINDEGEEYTTEVNPGYYEENGTPIDEEGNDMTYVGSYLK